jgi:hypothetical protein
MLLRPHRIGGRCLRRCVASRPRMERQEGQQACHENAASVEIHEFHASAFSFVADRIRGGAARPFDIHIDTT